MKESTTICDRCGARAEPEASWWELAFSRETLVEDLVEYTSEAWDLCGSCYDVVFPTVYAAVQNPNEGE